LVDEALAVLLDGQSREHFGARVVLVVVGLDDGKVWKIVLPRRSQFDLAAADA
jgi:hypothetical protein